MGNISGIDLCELYDNARDFLVKSISVDNAGEIVDSYLFFEGGSESSQSLDKVYLRLLESAQNANMKAGVVGGSIGGVEKLAAVLFDFDVNKVVGYYENDHDKLLNDVVGKLNPRGKIRITPQSIWPKYCKTALSSAAFLTQYNDGSDFFAWANHFYKDKRSMAALPLLLSSEIYGIGYPLACDFLKELGFVNYGKPDVHLIDIFEGIGLCEKGLSLYEIQKTIIRIAEAKNVTPYNVDKLFWLIGSGNFYNHSHIKTKRRKADFITFYNSRG